LRQPIGVAKGVQAVIKFAYFPDSKHFKKIEQFSNLNRFLKENGFKIGTNFEN
jgi:hypothetical protein